MIEEILTYWFGKVEKPEDFPAEKINLWFKKDDKIDQEIKEKFGHLFEEDLSEWDKESRGRLAHLLVLDQFSRHIYRDTPESFQYDQESLKLVIEGITQKMDQTLHPIMRAFFYMPLQHIEDLKIQDLSVQCYEHLQTIVPEAVKPMYHEFYKYAVRHRKPIARFGRFPHRNKILGRSPTPDEAVYLEETGGF